MSVQTGVVIVDRGAAIVTIDHRPDDAVVISIERLPFSLKAVAERTQELAETEVVIDAEGLGTALWAALPKHQHWWLYSARGQERQALVDALVVAIHENRLHFAKGLENQEAMSKAMAAYRRQVREDGLIGSELVVALLLAMLPPRNLPWAAWGPSLLGPPEPRVRVFERLAEDGSSTLVYGPSYRIRGDDDD